MRSNRRRSDATTLTSWILAIALSGCASTGANVRALRMYDHEQPTPELLREHVHQMADTIALIDALLNKTPYQPGASWISTLPLDDARADRARDLLSSASEKASFVRVYARHLQSVLDGAKSVGSGVPGGPVAAVPGYASLRDALSHVNPTLIGAGAEAEQALSRAIEDQNRRVAGLSALENPDPNEIAQAHAEQAKLAAELARLRADLARPVGPEDLRDPEKARIVQDAVTAVSVAARLATEAVSLATVVSLEAASLARRSPSFWTKNAGGTAELAATLPGDARRLYEDLSSSAAALKDLLGKLSALTKIDPLETVGFEFKDGLVDDVVGLAWDSLHVDVQAGGEALYYNAIADAERSTGDGGNTYDYTGRQTKLEYDVEPIVLARANLSLKLDWAHWADAAGLKLGFATNRMYKSGGDVGNGSLANELGVSGRVSEALDAALAIAGVKTSVRIAHFTHGAVRDVLVADGTQLATAPLSFDMKQIDLGYDLAPRRGAIVQSLTIGFRYFDYSLPRILYELVNSTPGAASAAYVFSRETPPQAIRTRQYMLDIAAGFEHPMSPHFAPFLNLDFAIGYGPTRYYFLRDPNGDDVPGNQEYSSSGGAGLAVTGALGFRWKLAGPEARLNAYLDACYQGLFISSLVDSKNQGDTIVNVATTDVFHGPTAAFGATF